MRKPRVLLVDDEPNVLDALRRVLRTEREHWELCFATSADEALAELERAETDVLVSDVNMPGKTGFNLLAEVRGRESTRDLPVIILTGNQESGLKRRALDLGATDLLNKPADPDELIARLRSALRLKSYQDDLKAQNEILDRKVRERTAEVTQSRLDIIWRLGKAAEFRDEETGNHVVRVGCYCRALAETMGLGRERAEVLLLASPLHDLGKIGVPDHILLKRGPLTDAEWTVMRRHCAIGAQILRQNSKVMETFLNWRGADAQREATNSRNPLLETAALIALMHHERWDGSGYPAGLRGPEIPVEARIVALADSFDALSSARPYKPAFPPERVMSIIREETGSHFDPEIYAVFQMALPELQAIRGEFTDAPSAVPAEVCAT